MDSKLILYLPLYIDETQLELSFTCVFHVFLEHFIPMKCISPYPDAHNKIELVNLTLIKQQYIWILTR